MLFFRALLAFLLLPTMVAGVIPAWIWYSTPHRQYWPGWEILTVGVLVLLACVREFYAAGKGTLAPWHPPKYLVTSGLYRYCRNPMYVGVLLILLGWAIAGRTSGLWYYALVVAVAFHLRVCYFEEPFQKRVFGADWEHYRLRVRRWGIF